MRAKTVKPKSLSSAANPLIRDVRRAIARGVLTVDGLAVAEGFHLLDEALCSGCEVPYILAAESALKRVEDKLQGLATDEIAVLPDALFDSIATTETTQGAIALVRLPESTADLILGNHALAVILDGIQDPGNAGAILRSAEAFGATGVVFLKGTVSPFHPKTLRASAGSIFRMPFMTCAELPPTQVRLYAAMPWSPQTRSAQETEFTAPCAIVIGSEGGGIRPELQRRAAPVAIPTRSVESLNAAVAASILLYEAGRQRAQQKP